ncbi:HupE/UreJ family protein [Pleionea sp. CnH1-48]|uniref:HupE/UreJ family protein n=1 Tax=Pleionea sp. CnH1-48 TaxID=2954494 RepID=UPI00209866C9|nr:HupE/UreJ family protein [Pleionea sp. CnH1-48]MCO7224234.1 HupE/UreJ family protein [Pleionea sp. CnH1-48]
MVLSLHVILRWLLLFSFLVLSGALFAHGVDDNTRQFLSQNQGVAIGPFLYIGAKHMVTGYDHLLFLVGVIFFLYRPKDVVIYVSFFTLGHSVTLLLGVLYQVQWNAYLIDAIIGLSIIYKGFDNLGGFQRCFNYQPNTRVTVLIFGLFHGLGLATKLQEFQLPQEGLWQNLLAFNVGVELGQFMALMFILLAISLWRRYESFLKFSTVTNTLLMSAGMMLVGYQLTGYWVY